jgi:hypothetical protein
MLSSLCSQALQAIADFLPSFVQKKRGVWFGNSLFGQAVEVQQLILTSVMWIGMTKIHKNTPTCGLSAGGLCAKDVIRTAIVIVLTGHPSSSQVVDHNQT